MTDFNFNVSILRDEMAEALAEKPEQLAYVLMQLGEKLPGTWAMDELLAHLSSEDGGDLLPQIAAFYRQIADALMEHHR